MRFASAVSTAADGQEAAREILAGLEAELAPGRADFLAVFVSGHDPGVFRDVVGRLESAHPDALSFGCTAEGTIGDGQEIERTPSVAALAAELPAVKLKPLVISQEDLEGGAEWAGRIGVAPAEKPVFLALGDPFSLDVRGFLDAMNAAFPGCPVIGGMASGGRRPGQNQLLLDGTFHGEGLVLLALTGNVQVDTVVSQGCRPVGRPYVVTKGEANVVRMLRNLTAMDALKEVAAKLSDEEQELMQHGLFLGRAIDEYKSQYGRGDFLIQNVLGADPKTGAIAIAGDVRVGTTVQFHVRDAASADEDLRNLLQTRIGIEGPTPAGALLFSCNGRGTNMWDDPGHDAGVLRELQPDIPVAGFFCAGEIGPIGGQNFIHGFTASIALLRPRDA